MINIKTGVMIFDEFKLIPHMTLENLLSAIKQDEILSQNNCNYINLYLKPQKCSESYFVLRLFFDNMNNQLKYCQIAVQSDDIVPSWEIWSESKEIERKKENDMWLQKEIGLPPYKYYWGEISSVYNAREASSYIVIQFYE